MSKFVLEITTDNAAFNEEAISKAHEVARILEVAVRKVFVQDQGVLLDSNGNTVGTFRFEEDS